MEGVKASAKK